MQISPNFMKGSQDNLGKFILGCCIKLNLGLLVELDASVISRSCLDPYFSKVNFLDPRGPSSSKLKHVYFCLQLHKQVLLI